MSYCHYCDRPICSINALCWAMQTPNSCTRESQHLLGGTIDMGYGWHRDGQVNVGCLLADADMS